MSYTFKKIYDPTEIYELTEEQLKTRFSAFLQAEARDETTYYNIDVVVRVFLYAGIPHCLGSWFEEKDYPALVALLNPIFQDFKKQACFTNTNF